VGSEGSEKETNRKVKEIRSREDLLSCEFISPDKVGGTGLRERGKWIGCQTSRGRKKETGLFPIWGLCRVELRGGAQRQRMRGNEWSAGVRRPQERGGGDPERKRQAAPTVIPI